MKIKMDDIHIDHDNPFLETPNKSGWVLQIGAVLNLTFLSFFHAQLYFSPLLETHFARKCDTLFSFVFLCFTKTETNTKPGVYEALHLKIAIFLYSVCFFGISANFSGSNVMNSRMKIKSTHYQIRFVSSKC